MKITTITQSEKYNEHREFKNQNENDRHNQSENDNSISFLEILKRIKKDTYVK
jgi:hypothetical protein